MKETFLARAGIVVESAFLAGGTGHVALPGKMSLDLEPQNEGGVARTSFWRTPQKFSSSFQHFAGRLELEFSATAPVNALLSCALEILSEEADTPSAGLTTTVYRVPLLGRRKSFSLVAEYDGGPYYRYDGVLVNRVRYTVQRRGGLPSIGFDLVAAKRTDVGSPQALIDCVHYPLSHANAVMEVGGVVPDDVLEFSWSLANMSTLKDWGEDGLATSFAESNSANLSGEFAQRITSTMFQDLASGQAETSILLAMDVDSVRRFCLECGRVKFARGTPPIIASGDPVFRAGWDAFHKTGTDATEPQLTIVSQ